MRNSDVAYEYIVDSLRDKLDMFGIRKDELNGDFDLVKSGLMDSMAFVSFVGDLEVHFGKELDFENILDDESFTTLEGLAKLFQK